jgi:uncharacterized secreted protein with C-terminal beta-propeller domain
MKKPIAWFLAGALLFAAVPAFVAAVGLGDEETAAASKDALPVVGSYDNLKKLLKTNWQERAYLYAAQEMDGESKSASPASARGNADRNAGYSTTNVQVQGVDEADVVKTDGTYLYQATPDDVRIIRAAPASRMKLMSRLTYEDGQFDPLEIYVDEKRLIVIGHSHAPALRDDSRLAAHVPVMVQALVYDIGDKQHPKLTRQLELDGEYLSSRKIGSSLYLTANKRIDPYVILEQKEEAPGPVYRDSVRDDGYRIVPYQDIRYFPEAIQPDYLLAAGVNLDNPHQPMSVHTYLGAGENVYASPGNLYVAVTEQPTSARDVNPFEPAVLPRPLPPDRTAVYRFALKDGALSFTGKGVVPGRILNQFSMDEHGKYLRIATTSGDVWRTDEGTSKNNLYVLDGQLNVTGKLEGIAPGERIYSVRFMGDRAYMVTFKKVDPLFVIDLKQPGAPAILGALKIPGYSDYLHPYDEHHIIGFGKDAVSDKEWAYYQGMKVALFDVTDVNNPKETFKTVIGDRGTDSELLSNHKALLFSPEKHLLAFPVTVRELTEAQKAAKEIHEYGRFTFQGAYVYRLDLQNGFTLRGKITHLSEADQKRAGDDWYDSEKNVQRILCIGDSLYTVSRAAVEAHDLSTMQKLGGLPLSNSPQTSVTPAGSVLR